MYAHTDAIRGFGATNDDLGSDIAAVAIRVSALPAATIAQAFGPVGARFAAALAEQCAQFSDDVGAMGATVSAAGAAATVAARRYQDVEHLARVRIGGIGL